MKLGLKRGEVRLVAHTVEWKEEFHRVKQVILHSTPIHESRIEHIGSTAIKGIVAKPILDLAVGVDDIEKPDKEILQGLKISGFLRLRVQRPNEIVLAKYTSETYEEKTHIIHLVDYNKELWKNLIFFRNYLNENKIAREQYRDLKKKFLEENNSGINEYTNYKEQFARGIVEKRGKT
ncbi:GrpB family protein [Bacillus sp. SD088]|uniref:GrpB family protein n=1 Tax=Bacillus sp. SD088 TaxID=2782012 RepID=UPI001A95CC3C|nr:GrpB family protein [Bacillus sp. SD088]MBO0992757.1 GrpB family protein [Bacillus sp. SD088]